MSITKNYRIKLLMLITLLSLTACGEKMMPAGITGYNHMNGRLVISNFTVNGATGSNLFQESGGGTTSCCVMIPEKWHSGLTAAVAWSYGVGEKDPLPAPPDQQKTVLIPEYKNGGKVRVHFYDNHQVKIIVSPCGIEHPFYPMSAQDKLPWVDGATKEEALDAKKRGVMHNDCQ